MEGDLDDLAKKIFIGNPLTPSSVQIVGSFETTKDLFEALLMLFTKGMKILFGDEKGQVDLKYLTSSDFQKFSSKFKALGINPIVKQYHISDILTLEGIEVSNDLLKDKETNSQLYNHTLELSDLADYQSISFKNLEDGRFQLSCENNYYILQFNTSLEK
jgi:hypothetical protein